jgi:hypothetical protein
MLSEARFRQMLDMQTAVAQKVYAAVPIGEAWTHQQINGEMRRNGTSHDLRVTAGCLNTLIRCGLIQERKSGHFIRAPIRKPSPPAPQLPEIEEEPIAMPATPPKPQQSQSAIDKLSGLAARVLDVAAAMQVIAADIENAALELEEQDSMNNQQLGKLKQLQTLLKSL